VHGVAKAEQIFGEVRAVTPVISATRRFESETAIFTLTMRHDCRKQFDDAESHHIALDRPGPLMTTQTGRIKLLSCPTCPTKSSSWA
jgi:hypothetical protein